MACNALSSRAGRAPTWACQIFQTLIKPFLPQTWALQEAGGKAAAAGGEAGGEGEAAGVRLPAARVTSLGGGAKPRHSPTPGGGAGSFMRRVTGGKAAAAGAAASGGGSVAASGAASGAKPAAGVAFSRDVLLAIVDKVGRRCRAAGR